MLNQVEKFLYSNLLQGHDMKLSIITINFNNENGLKKTLDSVACQTWYDFEHIIVDGASTDRSVEYVQTYALKSHPYSVIWLSEPDLGIYNAMNKGLRLAHGEYCLFLNSGDWLYDSNVLQKLMDIHLLGDIIMCNSIDTQGNVRYIKNPEDISLFTFMDETIQHSGSTFIRKDLFAKYGLYDETLKIVSDWKWFLYSVGLGRASLQGVDVLLSYFDVTGISSTRIDLRDEETNKVLEELPPRVLLAYKKYLLLEKSKLQSESKIRKSWSYRIGSFILRPLKCLKRIT